MLGIMEKIIMLGTGHAMTLDCYNTCFILQNNNQENILVDTGGGLQIIKQFRDANIDFSHLHHIIISHKHTDHLLGLFWIMRYAEKWLISGKYKGNLTIYLHQELEKTVRTILFEVLSNKYTKWIDDRIILKVVEDKEIVKIENYEVKFLDLQAKKEKQFGFKTTLENGETLAFLGDETFNENLKAEIQNTDWLMHEAMCLDSEAEIVKPYEKSHSTAKTAAQIANRLNVKNLIMYHASDNILAHRKEKYTQEAHNYFQGNIYMPDDLEKIEIRKK